MRLVPLLPLLAAATLGACLSPVPLDPAPQADLEARVAGAWRCLASEASSDEAPVRLTIARTRDRIYAVTVWDGDDAPDRYEAYASLVKGKPVVNIRELSSTATAEPWTFATYALLRPDILEVRVVDGDALEGVARTPAALRKRMESLDAGVLFPGFIVCARQKKE